MAAMAAIRIWRTRPAAVQATAAGARLSHVHVFLFGWSVYVLGPLLAGFAGVFDAIESAEPLARYFSEPSPWWTSLAAFAALMPVAFVLGHRSAGYLARPSTRRAPRQSPSWLAMFACLILLVAVAWPARSLVFEGYLEGVDSGVIGPIATLEMVLLYEYLLSQAAGLRTARRMYGSMLFVCSLLLLSMGGRLYVVSVLFILYFYWWKWQATDASARRRSIKWAVLAPLPFALLGMWRIGAIDVGSLGFYLFAEPIFTGISAVSFFVGGAWSLFDVPKDFLYAFLNIVPAAVWPDKASSLVSLFDLNLNFESPFGAISIITSSVANFGFVGGLVFVATVGLIIAWTGRGASSPVFRALYCFLVALLPFLFFRDPFQIQVKLVVTGVALALFHQAFTSRQWKARRLEVGAAAPA